MKNTAPQLLCEAMSTEVVVVWSQMPMQKWRGYCKEDGAAVAKPAGSGLSAACEVMWIPWLEGSTWILWKPQESSTEKVNIPVEPVLTRKPGYRRRGHWKAEAGVSLGGSMAASGSCCEVQLPTPPLRELSCPSGKSPPAAAPWALCKNICFSAQFCLFFFSFF